ncbi:hypothetical protein [Malacoplasma penetrans HF-2]|uniref:Uncharacterized protein n=1 Tax=Malacoplasma penetrans (strain HF-2) TaxID=272633 RepID=Q8EUT9_MALP2|nr:hypothetical protein [Malacoplasma penetrans]BAC44623.1 hypothetical protein [Malacoplasma penetrans HF-2]
MIFKKIRDLLISSLVIEIVAIALGLAAFYKIKSAFESQNIFEAVVNSYTNDYIALGLLGGFIVLSFIAFFLLPVIAACQYGSKLDVAHKGLRNLTVLTTPASFVFLPLVVILWPLLVLSGIIKSDLLYKRHRVVKNAKNDNKDAVKPQPSNSGNVVDLTAKEEQVEQPQNGMNGPIPVGPNGMPRPVPSNTGVYRPGQGAGLRPSSPNTIYVRDPNGFQRKI